MEPPRRKNVKNLGKGILPEEVNEYTKSKADTIIQKEQMISQEMFKCCLVSVIDDMPAIHWSTGIVGEVKLNDPRMPLVSAANTCIKNKHNRLVPNTDTPLTLNH